MRSRKLTGATQIGADMDGFNEAGSVRSRKPSAAPPSRAASGRGFNEAGSVRSRKHARLELDVARAQASMRPAL